MATTTISVFSVLVMMAALCLIAVATTTTTSAQPVNTDEARSIPADNIDRLQTIANQTAFQYEDIIDAESLNANSGLALSHTWSNLTIVPAGSSETISVLCGSSSYPTGGGFALGSADLQVVSSHAYAYQNGSKGWTATINNTNVSDSFPAIVDVLCLSEVGITTLAPTVTDNDAASKIPDEEKRMEMEQERLRKTVNYGYYNVGSNIECISTKAGETPSIEIYAENTHAPDAVVDFTLTAKRNADVSLDPADGFLQSATKRLTVLEGTQTLVQTFYVKPHANADSIQLTLDAKAVDPADIILAYTLPFSNTVVFFNDGSGNYCRE